MCLKPSDLDTKGRLWATLINIIINGVLVPMYYVNTCLHNNYVNESTLGVKVDWLHIKRAALPSVLHLEVLLDIIALDKETVSK